jgi:hypothetical protein
MVLQEDGGSPVSNYIVEKCDTRTGKWEPVSKFIRGTKYEVMGLDEGHEYKFRVSAENENGISEPLEVLSPVVAQHPYSKCVMIFFFIQNILFFLCGTSRTRNHL